MVVRVRLTLAPLALVITALAEVPDAALLQREREMALLETEAEPAVAAKASKAAVADSSSTDVGTSKAVEPVAAHAEAKEKESEVAKEKEVAKVDKEAKSEAKVAPGTP